MALGVVPRACSHQHQESGTFAAAASPMDGAPQKSSAFPPPPEKGPFPSVGQWKEAMPAPSYHAPHVHELLGRSRRPGLLFRPRGPSARTAATASAGAKQSHGPVGCAREHHRSRPQQTAKVPAHPAGLPVCEDLSGQTLPALTGLWGDAAHLIGRMMVPRCSACWVHLGFASEAGVGIGKEAFPRSEQPAGTLSRSTASQLAGSGFAGETWTSGTWECPVQTPPAEWPLEQLVLSVVPWRPSGVA